MKRKRLASITTKIALASTVVLGLAAPASATSIIEQGTSFSSNIARGVVQSSADAATRQQALADFRAVLVASGATADVVRFDALSTTQREELADYLVGESYSVTPPPNAVPDSNGALRVGDFSWAQPAGGNSSNAKSRIKSMQGGQTFSFAGIVLIEVVIDLNYSVSSQPPYGVSGVAGYDCFVTKDYDVLAEVSSVKSSAFVDGTWEIEARCKVTVKRGVPTPWGQITWSTKEQLHFLRGDNAGYVVDHGWK